MKFNLSGALQDALKIYIRHFGMIALSLFAFGFVQYVLYTFLHKQPFYATMAHGKIDAELIIPLLKICVYFVLSYIQLTMIYSFLWQFVQNKVQRSFIYFDPASYHVNMQSFFGFFALLFIKQYALKSYVLAQHFYRDLSGVPTDMLKLSTTGALTVFSFLCVYLSVRYVFAFPFMSLKHYSVSKAIKQSMNCSSHFSALHMVLITLISVASLATFKIQLLGVFVGLPVGVLFELMLLKQCEHK